jgi:membrane-bound lytic murein transglycosylase A
MRRLVRGALLPAVGAALLALAGCPPQAPPPDRLALARVAFADLPGWNDDHLEEAIAALRASCARLTARVPDAAVGPEALAARAGDWREACAAAAEPAAATPAGSRALLETYFVPFATAGNDGAEGLFTGYYEPELAVDAARSERFAAAIYRRPADLVTVDLGQFREEWRNRNVAGRVVDGRLRPYYTREQIVGGVLAGQNLELAWGEPVDVFFLEVQGSGVLRFSDGRQQRVNVDGQNGFAYTAIGAELVRDGELTRETVSMQSIRAWLAAHADRAPALMNRNRSYIFFRTVPEGPMGASGVVLTAGRSLAVDAAFIAYGLPLWLDIDDPMAPLPQTGSVRIRRLMVAQDRGGAIRGAVRGDFFWGTGSDAGERAGRMRSRGRAWLLLPKPLADRRTP